MPARAGKPKPKSAPEAEVAVLGGGPAGAAAARLLAGWGRDVVLLTRPAPGPPLAESLTPSCGRLLERIGVLDAMNGADFIRSSGHSVRWGPGDARVELFADGALGWQVARDALDRLFLRRAKDAGALVHRHANVRAVSERANGTLRIAFEERGRIREVGARWIIDCTGRAGLMSRSGSGRVASGPRTLAIVGTWERRPRWEVADQSHTVVESYDGGWAWSVPLTRTRRQVTVMLDPSRTGVARGSRLRLTYREELARTSTIRAMCESARFLGSPWARDASSYECEAPAAGRVLLAGDAASFVDPLSSFGVKKALASGWLAAVVVRSVLDDASLEGPALELFTSRERSMVAGLRRELDALAREAKGAHPRGFWDDRTGLGSAADSADPDVAALRLDADVRAAFDAIRERPSLGVVPGPRVRREARPLVSHERVTLAEHLVAPAFPEGIRFVRNVNLPLLADLAVRHDQVPALIAAYGETAPPAPLPDMLGALAVLVGKHILVFA
jgi:flavin-dependent dehydrogenase